MGDPDAQRRAARNRPAAEPAPASTGESGTLYQLAYVKGRIAPFDGNYRRALDLVNAYAEALRQLPGVDHVRIQSLPLDIDSESTLRGDAAGSTAPRQAEFELRIAVEDKSGEA